ncbi:hypothetical protein [Pseudomonas chlororaphis]|uniref:hypothetical protein n=1 Tax=Pseudomonas chlororaphis TaxID=587753 RepID=UPI00236603AD|nr:hypothetical protein [Pseudomonas chlororaphis]WDH20457.1 hypothetical protein PUP50_20850 [Pseudomonas chlororaphis]
MTITFSILDCVPIHKGRCLLIVGAADDSLPEEMDSYLMSFSEDTGRKVQKLWFPALKAAYYNNEIFIIGEQGEVARCDIDMSHEASEEIIEGPENYGPLVSIQSTRKGVYAVGMARQVYARDPSGEWSLISKHIIDQGSPAQKLISLNSITQLENESLYAVGLEGEIWHTQNMHWKQSQSPTNVDLTEIAKLPSGDAIILGCSGVLLCGRDNIWEVIEHSSTTEDLISTATFRETSYISTERQLFTLDMNKNLQEIATPKNNTSFLPYLKACKDSLWIFGDRDVFWTSDLNTWHKADV